MACIHTILLGSICHPLLPAHPPRPHQSLQGECRSMIDTSDDNTFDSTVPRPEKRR